MKKDTKRYIIYEDVTIEVRDALMEYIEHLEDQPGSLFSDSDKIRTVLHHFESGLCLIAAKKR